MIGRHLHCQHQAPKKQATTSPPLLSTAELVDKLHYAQRHGQCDRVRRIAARLAIRGRPVHLDPIEIGGGA